VVLAASVPGIAQQVDDASAPAAVALVETATLPDAPAPVSQGISTSDAADQAATGQPSPAVTGGYVQGKQTKRILGVVPNFRSVSADVHLPPQSVKEKFTTTVQESFDYSAFIFVGALAGVAQAQDSYPEFHQGAAGYARYFWHTFADQSDENAFTQFILPAALHQDSRYYTLGHGGVVKRAAYAFSRLAITRNDDGNESVNFSEIVGAGAASGISDLYYPSQERTWTKTGQRWLVSMVLDGATFTFQEFWPDINDHIFHQHD
jgi:hypothetical protein